MHAIAFAALISLCYGQVPFQCDDSKFKSDILKAHNDLRAKVLGGTAPPGQDGPLPKAKSMPNLEWDDSLASAALMHSSEMKFEHGDITDIPGFPGEVGQNIYRSGTTGQLTSLNGGAAAQSWAEETKFMKIGQIAKFTDEATPKTNDKGGDNMIGHFTQMIWAKSTKIGCGGLCYKEGKWNRQMITCNYAPAGNVLTEKIYEV